MNQQLQPIEHNSQRILTTQQLAEAYEADIQLIINNFNRNKDRYTEGKHYYALEGAIKTGFLNQHQIDLGSKHAKTLYLWTEKGAWLHAKSLNTDKAWEAYELLVDEYYRIIQQATLPPALPESVFSFHIKINCSTIADVKRERQILDHIEKAYALHTGKQKPTAQPALKIVKPRELAQSVYDANLSPLENVYRAIIHIIEAGEKPPTLRDMSRYLYQLDKEVLKQAVSDGVNQGKLHEDKSGKSPRYSLI